MPFKRVIRARHAAQAQFDSSMSLVKIIAGRALKSGLNGMWKTGPNALNNV